MKKQVLPPRVRVCIVLHKLGEWCTASTLETRYRNLFSDDISVGVIKTLLYRLWREGLVHKVGKRGCGGAKGKYLAKYRIRYVASKQLHSIGILQSSNNGCSTVLGTAGHTMTSGV